MSQDQRCPPGLTAKAMNGGVTGQGQVRLGDWLTSPLGKTKVFKNLGDGMGTHTHMHVYCTVYVYMYIYIYIYIHIYTYIYIYYISIFICTYTYIQYIYKIYRVTYFQTKPRVLICFDLGQWLSLIFFEVCRFLPGRRSKGKSAGELHGWSWGMAQTSVVKLI